MSAKRKLPFFPWQGLPLDPESFLLVYDNDTAVRELVDAVDFALTMEQSFVRYVLKAANSLADTRYAQTSLFLASAAMPLALDNVGIQVTRWLG